MDPKYVPNSSDGVFLFEAKQMFAFSVLEECLQTDRGKTLDQTIMTQIMLNNFGLNSVTT
jgi:hypothetical protein